MAGHSVLGALGRVRRPPQPVMILCLALAIFRIDERPKERFLLATRMCVFECCIQLTFVCHGCNGVYLNSSSADERVMWKAIEFGKLTILDVQPHTSALTNILISVRQGRAGFRCHCCTYLLLCTRMLEKRRFINAASTILSPALFINSFWKAFGLNCVVDGVLCDAFREGTINKCVAVVYGPSPTGKPAMTDILLQGEGFVALP